MRKIVLVAGVFLLAAIALPAFGTPHQPGTGSSPHIACGNTDGYVTYSPTTLWPPNHRDVPITIQYHDTDGDGDSTMVAEALKSNSDVVNGQELNGSGPPDSVKGPDYVQGTPGTGSDTGTTETSIATTTPTVRAERSGQSKDGRTYTLTVTCTDSGGGEYTTGMVDITVFVPHDQGHN